MLHEIGTEHNNIFQKGKKTRKILDHLKYAWNVSNIVNIWVLPMQVMCRRTWKRLFLHTVWEKHKECLPQSCIGTYPSKWDPFDFRYYTFSKGKLFITLPWEREERRKSCIGSRDQWALSAKHTCSNVAPYCRLQKKKKLIRYFHSQHSCLNLEPNNIIFTCERNRNNVKSFMKEIGIM